MADSAPASPLASMLAAVDLGSNSFHMVVAEEGSTGLRLLDRLREGVRLAEGLRSDGGLDPEVQQRALACLARFGQRLQGIPPERVRVIGTNTLRDASAAQGFLQAVEQTLGYPVEIVSGREEARLVYLGVAHSLAVDADERRLVVDIGGGSTELVAGRGFLPAIMESLHFGCVASTRAHFPDGRILPMDLARLEKRVRVALEPVLGEYLAHGWEQVVGSSGTVKAIARILAENNQGPRITMAGLRWLRARVLRAGSVEALLQIKGMKNDRAAVFPGGVGILYAIFEALQLKEMRFSDGALREGAIYELLGRIHQEDTRESSILNLQKRFHSHVGRNERVRRQAMEFFANCADAWKLSAWHGQCLAWAALTHDIGLDIAHSGFHKHGEYIWRNADIPGFSRREQGVVAALLRAQRKRLPSLPQLAGMGVIAEDIVAVQRLAVLLRLAILFHHGADPLPFSPRLRSMGETITLLLPNDWQGRMPLLAADLEREQGLLDPDFSLQW